MVQIVVTLAADGAAEDLPEWRAFTGQTREAAHSRGWLDALHPADRAHAMRLWEAQEPADAPREAEVRIRREDGAYRAFVARLAPLPAAGGAERAWVGIFTDVTSAKRMEQALTAARDELAAHVADTARLQELLTRLSAAPDIPAMLREVLLAALELQSSDRGVVLLFDPLNQDLSPSASVGLPDGVLRLIEHLPIGAPLIDQRQVMVIVPDVESDPLLAPYHELARLFGIRALYSVPLVTLRGEVVGALVTGFGDQHAPAPRERLLVELFARQAADVLDRARLLAAEQQAHAAAEARAAELAAVIEAITDGVYLHAADGSLLLTNAAGRRVNPRVIQEEYLTHPFGERISQLDVRDAEGQPLAPEDTPVAHVLRGEVLTGEQTVDTRMRTDDGREILLNVSGAPLRGEGGEIRGGVIVTRDVTERRALEQRMGDALGALLDMAETLVSGVADLDEAARRGATRAVARRLADLTCRVLGCRRVSILAIEPETETMRPIAVAGLAPAQEQHWWEVESREHRLGEAPSDPAVLARLRAGETVVLDMSQPPFRDQPNPLSAISPLVAPMRLGERMVGLLALDHGPVAHVYAPDETALAGAVAKLCALVIERERLQAAREQAQTRELALREANFRMDEFLSIASHELRTPLTTIRANVQLIERRLRSLLLAADTESADDQGARVAAGTLEAALTQRLESLQLLLNRTDRQTLRLDRLVGDLLDVSRIQAGNLDLRLEPCDLARVVREAVEEQRASWPERRLTLALPAGPLAVMADADRIGQVVTNYLTNALKYSPAREPVAVVVRVEHARAKRGQPRVRVRVRDHGPGLLADEQARIWERFHRVPGITLQSGSGVGLGLGLYIAKTIVERHGGTVGVESAPAAGSTFWFTLPLAI